MNNYDNNGPDDIMKANSGPEQCGNCGRWIERDDGYCPCMGKHYNDNHECGGEL